MKLFGEFLVEKGLVSAKDLLSALLEQSRQAPLFPEVIQRRALMSDEQLLSVLAYQAKNGGNFRSVCETLGLWTLAIEVTVTEEILAHRVPLGRVLVESGAIKLGDLTRALDEFFSAHGKENHMLHQVPSQSFSGLFDEAKKRSLVTFMRNISSLSSKPEGDQLTENLLGASEVLRVLRGAALVANLPLTAGFMDAAETTLRSVMAKHTALPLPKIVACAYVYEQFADIIWALRDSIAQTGSETKGWSDNQMMVEALRGEFESIQREILELAA